MFCFPPWGKMLGYINSFRSQSEKERIAACALVLMYRAFERSHSSLALITITLHRFSEYCRMTPIMFFIVEKNKMAGDSKKKRISFQFHWNKYIKIRLNTHTTKIQTTKQTNQVANRQKKTKLKMIWTNRYVQTLTHRNKQYQMIVYQTFLI